MTLHRFDEQLSYLVASLHRRLDQIVRDNMSAERIPAEQFRVLTALADRDGETMGNLAARALLDPTTLTKMIDRMVSDALVYRAHEPSDRRKVLIFLASRGRSVLKHASGIAAEERRVLTERLDPAEADRLTDLLRELVRPGAASD